MKIRTSKYSGSDTSTVSATMGHVRLSLNTVNTTLETEQIEELDLFNRREELSAAHDALMQQILNKHGSKVLKDTMSLVYAGTRMEMSKLMDVEGKKTAQEIDELTEHFNAMVKAEFLKYIQTLVHHVDVVSAGQDKSTESFLQDVLKRGEAAVSERHDTLWNRD